MNLQMTSVLPSHNAFTYPEHVNSNLHIAEMMHSGLRPDIHHFLDFLI